MKIVISDGYTENPGDLSWSAVEALGDLVVYDRTSLTDEEETIRQHAALHEEPREEDGHE